MSSIIDLVVQTRARASLPATHLRIMKIKNQENTNISKSNLIIKYFMKLILIYVLLLFIKEFGVFARKTIQKRTQFGPLEGVQIKDEECIEESNNDEFKYLLEIHKNFRRIDVTSEGKEF